MFRTAWQLYKYIELHVARWCTMDYATVFQLLFSLTLLCLLKHEKTLIIHLHLNHHMTVIVNLNKTIVRNHENWWHVMLRFKFCFSMLSVRHLLNTSHQHVCDTAAYSLYFLMPKRIKKNTHIKIHTSPLFGTPFPRSIYLIRLIMIDNQGARNTFFN